MDINLFTEIFFRHHRTLDMPSRTSVSPRRRPGRFPFFFRFPEYKIHRIFLFIADSDTDACRQIIQILFGQLAIAFKLPGPIIYSAIYRVGIALIDQRLNHLDHTVNFFRCLRMGRCFFYIQPRHVCLSFFNITLGDDGSRNALFVGLFNNFIIYVCKIGYIVHIIALILKISTHRIKNDHRSGISDMNIVIYGRSAYIHTHLSLFHWNKFFFFP